MVFKCLVISGVWSFEYSIWNPVDGLDSLVPENQIFQDRLYFPVLKISPLNGVANCHHPYITSSLRKLGFENEGVLFRPWQTGRRSFWSKASLLRLQFLSRPCAAALLCRRQQGRGRERRRAVWCRGQRGRQVSLWAGQSKGTVRAHPLWQPRFRWPCSSYLMLGVQKWTF